MPTRSTSIFALSVLVITETESYIWEVTRSPRRPTIREKRWGGIEPSRWLRIVQTGLFLKKWSSLGLDDDDLLALEVEILKGPEHHPIIRGTGGVRKVRFARPGAGRGKSGAYRVCYAYFARRGMVFLLTAYGKNERANLTRSEQAAIGAVLRGIEESIDRGEIR